MEINKLNNQINGRIEGSKASEQGQKASGVSPVRKNEDIADKVSLSGGSAKKSDELFARIELEKINQASFSKLQDYKEKLKAYEEAKAKSPEAAAQTEIGKKLNDPQVWSDIAQKMLGE